MITVQAPRSPSPPKNEAKATPPTTSSLPPPTTRTQSSTLSSASASIVQKAKEQVDADKEDKNPAATKEPSEVVIQPRYQQAPTKISRWWELLLPENRALKPEVVQYLEDQTVPWSKQGYQHVLTPANGWKNCNYSACFDDDTQDEIILAITKSITEAPEPNIPTQPMIHFVGHEAYVSSLYTMALVHLWFSPPIFRGQPMTFVSKGLFFKNPYVSNFVRSPAMKKEAFVEAFKSHFAPHVAKSKTGPGLHFAFAKFYEVSGLPGGPIFTGQVLLISDEIDVGEKHKPSFLK